MAVLAEKRLFPGLCLVILQPTEVVDMCSMVAF